MALKLGIILQHPLSSSLGTIVRVLGFSRALAEQNVQVNIFSPLEQNRLIEKNLTVYNIKAGFSLTEGYRIAKLIYRSHFLAKRLLINETMITAAARRLVRGTLEAVSSSKLELDLIQGEQEIPSLAAADVGASLSIPSVADFHNVWAEEVVDIGILSDKETVLKDLTRKVINRTDLVFTPTNYMSNYLKERYCAKNVAYIPSGSSLLTDSARGNYQAPYKIVYSGSLEKHENVELYIQAAALAAAQRKDVEFYVTGKGEDASELKRLASQINAPVRFLWFQSGQEYHDFLLQCHIGIIPWEDKMSRRLGFPMKLLDYESAGLATIATKIEGWVEAYDGSQAILSCDPEPQKMADTIIHLLQKPDEIRKIGETARLVAKEAKWSNSAKIMIREYSELLKKSHVD